MLPALGVVQSGVQAVSRGTQRPEQDAKPCFVKARQRSGEPPSFGSEHSSGTRTSSRTSSLVTDARNDIFDSRSWSVKPAVSVGTTKPRIPSSERAQMTARSAI